MGIVQKPTARSYFSKRRVISTPGFADVISRERFELICKFLHFIENDSLPTYQGPPILFKICRVICHLNIKFQILYLPNQNIAIDESMTLWKGRLSKRKYLPLKAPKFRIKLSNHANRIFVVFSSIYRPKHGPTVESDYSRHPQNSSCITGTLKPLFVRWHTLWIDNYFSSTELARKLKFENSTNCVGTLNLNRKNVSKKVEDKKVEKGEIIARHSGPVTVLKLRDKRQHSSTAEWKTFSEKSGTQNWKIKTSAEVCCVLKSQKKKTSVYCFQICDVSLCLEDCFELYHTKLNYWGNDNYFTTSI